MHEGQNKKSKSAFWYKNFLKLKMSISSKFKINSKESETRRNNESKSCISIRRMLKYFWEIKKETNNDWEIYLTEIDFFNFSSEE
jgi:hypothetical protein